MGIDTMTKTVREFSPIGPCLTLGEFVKRTPKFIFYIERHTGYDGPPEIRRVGGWKVNRDNSRGGYIHTEPCHSCRDHAETQYPNGYMD